jgi:hypothetical protein
MIIRLMVLMTALAGGYVIGYWQARQTCTADLTRELWHGMGGALHEVVGAIKEIK